MKRKMGKKQRSRRYREWWKNHLDYCFKEELRIYKYLCGNKMVRKPPRECRFIAYKEWEEYIKQKYKDIEKDKLQEFYYYLNQKKRNASMSQGVTQNFMLPIISALIAGYMVPEYFSWGSANTKLKEMTIYVQSIHYLCVGVIFFVVIFYLISSGLNMVYNHNEEYYFYEDYQKIIKVLIEEKNELF